MVTYLQILNLIKDTALAQPNVNSVVREFLDLNREDAKYSAVVIQDRDGSRDRIEEQGYITYTWHLGYVDRLTYDESNRDDIISTGINIINNIVNTIRNTWFPELEVSIIDRISTFNQRFTAQCAGVYVVLAVNAQVSDCVDSESNDLYDKFEMTFTKNGHYHYVPSGRPIDEIDITIDCPEPKKEELLKETIISNGSYSYDPKEGSVFNRADITVDVHPSISLSETYISNGSYNITGEFNGGVITVDVPIDGWDQKNVTEGTVEIINLDNSASFVAGSAFKDNKNIQTVNLPYATSVGHYAFQGCHSLSQVSLPMCSYIDRNAFYDCYSLSQVSLPVCEYIGNAAFFNCVPLSRLILPVCSYVGNYTFQYCYSLSQLILPVCEYIGSSVFQYCYSLSQLILPVCSYIGNNAFRDCSSLTQVSLPVCSYINNYTFYGCSSLSQVSLPMCSYINDNAFWGCSSLTQVSLPVCSYISNNAFRDCSSLSQVSLPVCSYINDYAFFNCVSLSQVSLPVCKYIGNNAFQNCSLLSIITIGYSGVCRLTNNEVFSNTQITSSTGSIYVPASLVDSYKTADYWSYFKDRIFTIPS